MKSGVKKSRSGKYIGQIFYQGKQRHLGTYDTEEAAHAAYLKAWEAFHERPYDRQTYTHSLTLEERIARIKSA